VKLINISKIKNDFKKVTELKSELRNIKDYSNILGIFSLGLINTPIWIILTKLIYTSSHPIVIKIMMGALGLGVTFFISLFVSLGIVGVINLLYEKINKKEISLINNINISVLKKSNILNKSQLKKILDKNEKLSKSVKETKSAYFNVDDDSESCYLYNIVLSKFNMEKTYTFDLYYEYIDLIKKDIGEEYIVNFITTTMYKLVKESKEEDLFANKNELIDFSIGHLKEISHKKEVLNIIKSKVSEYNYIKEEEDSLKKDLIELKKEKSMKENVKLHIVEKEKKLIIKSI
jgi:hypothetical protein